MALEKQECCYSGVALSFLVNKDKAALPWKIAYFTVSVSLKGKAGVKAGVLSGISMLSLHMPHHPASTGRS